MIKLYVTQTPKKEFLFFALVFITIPLILGSGGDSILAIVWSHYITLVVNTLFIIYSYRRYAHVNHRYSLIVTRIGLSKLRGRSLLYGAFSILVYSTLLYGYMLLYYGMPPIGQEELLIRFMILNTFVFIIEQTIMNFQLGTNKNPLHLFLPLILNMVFHYYFVPVYL